MGLDNEIPVTTLTLPTLQEEPSFLASACASLTVLTNDNGNLTKTFLLDENGNVQKQAAARLVCGRFQVRHVYDLAELNAIHDSLTRTQAVTYGRPLDHEGVVVARSVKNPASGAITRTRINFQFPRTAGVMMLDYDPPKDGPALAPTQLLNVIRQCCVQLTEVGMLWRASASSGVASAGVTGQRIYILVSDAAEIPRIGQTTFDRLWLAGFGYYAISVSGQLLERGPVDTSVWKPEGLDFAAPPVLKDGITRTSYPSEITGHGVLNAALFADLTESEKQDLGKLKAAARDAIKPKADAVKVKYVQDTLPLLASRLKALGKDADELTLGIILERAAMNRVLMGDFPLLTADGKSVTVADLLDNPEKWHATRVADPLEPEVDGRAGWLNLLSGGTPYLYSHLHHGTRYRLERAPALIQVCTGELPRMVDSLAGLLKKSGQIFERGGGIAYVNSEQKIVLAKAQWMAVQVQRICRFEAVNRKKEWVIADCPAQVINGLLADAARFRMPKLTAVRTAPTMNANGRLINLPGYDQESGLLLVNDRDDQWPAMPASPAHADLKKAMQVLWKPFELFPYADVADKSVALAAVLTAAVRSCLRTSPGFGFSATAAGTGKTLLAQCVGTLYDGVTPAVSTPIVHEEEWAKSLFTSALGGAGTLLFDNAEHSIESASLCAITTAPAIKGRILGETREAEAEHRMLVLATGNGLQLVGDLNRRFFVCRLDAHMDASVVATRQFDLEPLSYCLKNRLSIITAALTLIQAYARAGFPKVCDGLASMDDWNKLVRSSIIWLIQQEVLEGFVDPKVALQRDSGKDPDAAALAGVLDMVKTSFGANQSFTLADLVKRVSSPVSGWTDLLKDIAGDHNGINGINTRKLGQWMTKRDGRIMNGMSIKHAGLNRQNTATWMLVAK